MAGTPCVLCFAVPVGPRGLAVHSDHLVADPSQSLLAMVARTVTRREVSITAAASRSLSDEAAKLIQKGAWGPKGVREWQQVADNARKSGGKAHAGRIIIRHRRRETPRAPTEPPREDI